MERRTMAETAFIFALATFVLWGTTNFLISYGEKKMGIDPTMFTAVMWLTIGALGVALFAYLFFSGKLETDGVKFLYPVAAGAFLGVGILFFAYALSHVGQATGMTAAIATSNAVFTVLLAMVFMKEHLDLKQWIGIGTVVLGIVILRI